MKSDFLTLLMIQGFYMCLPVGLGFGRVVLPGSDADNIVVDFREAPTAEPQILHRGLVRMRLDVVGLKLLCYLLLRLPENLEEGGMFRLADVLLEKNSKRRSGLMPTGWPVARVDDDCHSIGRIQ